MDKTEINRAEISSKASSFKDQLGGEKKFDNTRFDDDAERAQLNGFSLDSLNAEDYRKKDDDENEEALNKECSNRSGFGFKCRFENGMHVARGPEGKVITAKTEDELTSQPAQEFLKHAEKTGEEPYAHYTDTKKRPEGMKSFAKNFINAAVQVDGDLPNDPQFWQQLKQDYLKNPEHNMEQWNKLTAKVPPEFMGEKAKTKDQSMSKHIKNLRNGLNTNLTPVEKTSAQRTTVNQMSLNQVLQNQGR